MINETTVEGLIQEMIDWNAGTLTKGYRRMSYYYDHQDECVERRIDYDLSAACDHNDASPFRLEDVAYVLAYIQGENDGPAYHWIVAMKDHTYAYVTGGCDYTGWDCQSYVSADITITLKEALAKAEESDRKILRGQLTGQIAFGVSNE